MQRSLTYFTQSVLFELDNCLALVPNPQGHFGPLNEVKKATSLCGPPALVGADQGACAFLCLAPAPSPSSRFGPPYEVKERLHWSALQRFSRLTKVLALFFSFCGKIGQNVEFV